MLLRYSPKRNVIFMSSLKAWLPLAVYCFKATFSGPSVVKALNHEKISTLFLYFAPLTLKILLYILYTREIDHDSLFSCSAYKHLIKYTLGNAGSVSLSTGIMYSISCVLPTRSFWKYIVKWIYCQTHVVREVAPKFHSRDRCLVSAFVFLGEGVINSNSWALSLKFLIP